MNPYRSIDIIILCLCSVWLCSADQGSELNLNCTWILLNYWISLCWTYSWKNIQWTKHLWSTTVGQDFLRRTFPPEVTNIPLSLCNLVASATRWWNSDFWETLNFPCRLNRTLVVFHTWPVYIILTALLMLFSRRQYWGKLWYECGRSSTGQKRSGSGRNPSVFHHR